MYNNFCVVKRDAELYIGRGIVQTVEKYSRG